MADVCIFVVDDDFLIAQSVEDALTDGGFLTATANNGSDGLALMDKRGPECRALVTDVNLGDKVTGWDVARAARMKFPYLPVVYVTADSSHEWTAHGVPESILITKPFAPAQVVSAVAQLLNRESNDHDA